MARMPKHRKIGLIVAYSVAVSLVAALLLLVFSPADRSYAFSGGDDVPLQLFLGWLFFLTLSGVLALIASAVANRAERSGRSWLSFFWMSALVSPIIMGIIAVSLKPLDSSEASSPPNDELSLESRLMELEDLKAKGLLSENEVAEAKKKALGL